MQPRDTWHAQCAVVVLFLFCHLELLPKVVGFGPGGPENLGGLLDGLTPAPHPSPTPTPTHAPTMLPAPSKPQCKSSGLNNNHW